MRDPMARSRRLTDGTRGRTIMRFLRMRSYHRTLPISHDAVEELAARRAHRPLASFVQGQRTPRNVRKGLNDEFSLTHPYAPLQRLGGIPREHRNLALSQDWSGIEVTIDDMN